MKARERTDLPLLKLCLCAGIAIALLMSGCEKDNPVTPQKDIEILKPKPNTPDVFPETVLDIIVKYNIAAIDVVYKTDCFYSLDKGKTWSDSMVGISRKPDRIIRGANFDYAAFEWIPGQDKIADTTIYIKVQGYSMPAKYDIVGPIKILAKKK